MAHQRKKDTNRCLFFFLLVPVRHRTRRISQRLNAHGDEPQPRPSLWEACKARVIPVRVTRPQESTTNMVLFSFLVVWRPAQNLDFAEKSAQNVNTTLQNTLFCWNFARKNGSAGKAFVSEILTNLPPFANVKTARDMPKKRIDVSAFFFFHPRCIGGFCYPPMLHR